MLVAEKTPLRNLAQPEPLAARARQLYAVPFEIKQSVVAALGATCGDFLTVSPPAPPLYSLNGDKYFLNYRVSQMTPAQRFGVLECLGLPNGVSSLQVLKIDKVNNTATLELRFFNTNSLAAIISTFAADPTAGKRIFPLYGGYRIPAGTATGQVQIAATPAAVVWLDHNVPALQLTVAPVGDYSNYTLGVNGAEIKRAGQFVFDPLLAEIGFKFRPGCFSFNCAPEWEAGEPTDDEPRIDYLAKDYESFRLALIAAMTERVPGWQPSSEADLDQVLIDLFSAAGDELSDFQDRVANEAYLASARQRVSLARHARLMDYHLHQGNQASTWLALELDLADSVTKELKIDEGFEVWAGRAKNDAETVLFMTRYRRLQPVHQLFNSLSLYTWGDSIPTLAAGSTQADLRLFLALYSDAAPPRLTPAADQASAELARNLINDGTFTRLVIQERLNPATGQPAGRNPTKRQLLQLLRGSAEALPDPITGEWFVRVRWRKEDALRHSYCFTIKCPNPTLKVEHVSLFHGNLVEVFHGRWRYAVFQDPALLLANEHEFHYERTESLAAACCGDERAGQTRWGTLCRLPEKALAYRDTPPGGEIPPQSSLQVNVALPGGGADEWDEVPSLIHSDDSDENGDHFIVETDELRRSRLRFGNGVNGKELPDMALAHCFYQVGEGLDGNIGLDKLIDFDRSVAPGNQIRRCWNPFDVTSGRTPEPASEIIRRVPEAYRARQLRAVTLDDYVARAEEVPGVSRAAARYAWTGSWRTVQVAIDPVGTNILTDELRRQVARQLEAVRLIGEDLELRPPRFVPLEIHLVVCAAPDFWPEDVRFVLEQEFSATWTPDGRRGFFHPDRWTFGQTLHASQILARALAVQGVEHVVSVKMKRWNSAVSSADFSGVLRANEILQVNSDPNRLEFGFIAFEVKGGRR